MPDYTAPSSSAIEDNAGTPGLASGITESEIRSLLNIENADFISAVEGEATLALSGSVTVATGQTLVSPRLPTISVSGSTTLSEATHAGRYLICAGNVTLPSTSSAGEHYAILNTTGGNITIGRNSRNINGAGSDFTLATYKGATCIAIGSNNWIVLG